MTVRTPAARTNAADQLVDATTTGVLRGLVSLVEPGEEVSASFLLSVDDCEVVSLALESEPASLCHAESSVHPVDATVRATEATIRTTRSDLGIELCGMRIKWIPFERLVRESWRASLNRRPEPERDPAACQWQEQALAHPR